MLIQSLQPLHVRFSEWQRGNYEDYDGGIDGLHKHGSGVCHDPGRLEPWRLSWVSGLAQYGGGK
jgi:hypothetical protein